MTALTELLSNQADFSPIIRNNKSYKKLDFSETNAQLMQTDLSDTFVFAELVFEEMLSHATFNGIGGYKEHRVIYRQLDHFVKQEENPRCIHLGVDIWAPAGEAVYAPVAGRIHSFAFNNNQGDYGPTIILEHQLDGTTFYTLYGHLSLDALDGLYENKPVQTGEKIAEIGPFPENGDWPPHLHFQVIQHMGTLKGDFPGVCSIPDSPHYLSLCPDPNLILRIDQI